MDSDEEHESKRRKTKNLSFSKAKYSIKPSPKNPDITTPMS